MLPLLALISAASALILPIPGEANWAMEPTPTAGLAVATADLGSVTFSEYDGTGESVAGAIVTVGTCCRVAAWTGTATAFWVVLVEPFGHATLVRYTYATHGGRAFELRLPRLVEPVQQLVVDGEDVWLRTGSPFVADASRGVLLHVDLATAVAAKVDLKAAISADGEPEIQPIVVTPDGPELTLRTWTKAGPRYHLFRLRDGALVAHTSLPASAAGLYVSAANRFRGVNGDDVWVGSLGQLPALAPSERLFWGVSHENGVVNAGSAPFVGLAGPDGPPPATWRGHRAHDTTLGWLSEAFPYVPAFREVVRLGNVYVALAELRTPRTILRTVGVPGQFTMPLNIDYVGCSGLLLLGFDDNGIRRWTRYYQTADVATLPDDRPYRLVVGDGVVTLRWVDGNRLETTSLDATGTPVGDPQIQEGPVVHLPPTPGQAWGTAEYDRASPVFWSDGSVWVRRFEVDAWRAYAADGVMFSRISP